MIGYLVASYSVCQFIASPILGGLSDRYGRRPLLIYSQVGSMLGFILLGFAHTLPLLFLSRIIDGISGGNLTIAQAYIADVTEPKDRSSALGLIGVAFGLGFMIGPLAGGELADAFGYSAPAFLAAGLSLSSTLLTMFYLREPQHRPDAEGKRGLSYYKKVIEYFQDKNLRLLLSVFLFFALPFSLYVSMFSLYAKIQLDFTPSQVGRFLAFIGLLGIIWQGAVIRPLVRRIGELMSLRISLICLVLGLLGIVVTHDWTTLMLIGVIFSFGSSITRPTLTSLITQAAPPQRKGGALGVAASIESATRSVAPILGGWIIGGLHPNYIGYVGGALATIAVLLAFGVHRDSRTLEAGGMG